MKLTTILKRVFKWFLGIIGIVMLLFFLVAGLIQLPAIQNKIVKQVTTYVSKKTNTKIAIRNVGISFPKYVVIEGLYIEDERKDTLLFADKAKINLSFKDLFHNKINIYSFSLDNSSVNVSRIGNDSIFNFNFLLTAFSDTTVKTKTASPWAFNLDNASLKGVRLHYHDEYSGMIVSANLQNLSIKDVVVDLQKQTVSIDKFNLSESEVKYEAIKAQIVKVASSKPSSESDWKVKVRSIELDGNSIDYKSGKKPIVLDQFDPNHLFYHHLILQASNLDYSSDHTSVAIKKFSTTDQNNFAITNFETEFRLDPTSITAKKTKIKTTNSNLEADLNLHYASFQTLLDSLQFSNLNLDIQSAAISNSDILYFVPELKKQAFFTYRAIKIIASGRISGPLNNLAGKNLILKTGSNTMITSDFTIAGLPDYQTATFNFPNLKINSGREDIGMMAGTYLPNSFELPENIGLNIVFDGRMKAFKSSVSMSSSFGNAQLVATIDQHENFKSTLKVDSFNLGSLLKDKILYGPVTLTAESSGHGLDKNTMSATFNVVVSQLYLNKYNYRKLNLEGSVDGQKIAGKIKLKDENLDFDFDGKVNLNPNQEQYQFNLTLAGADLQRLNFAKDDMRIGFSASADFKGGSYDVLSGKAGMSKIIVAQNGKKFSLESVLLTLVNHQGKSELIVNSALVDVKYSGTVSPLNLSAELQNFINSYFQFSDPAPKLQGKGPSNFAFEIQLHNHPILSQVLFPELKEFEPGIIEGSFDSQKNSMMLHVLLKRIVYGSSEIHDFAIVVNSDKSALNYKISCRNISNSQVNLDNLLVEGKLADQKMTVNLSSIDEKQNKKLLVRSLTRKDQGNYKLTLDPKDFFLMNKQWNVAADNLIVFGKQGFLIHHLFLNNGENQLNIASVHDQFNDDLNISIKNFKLDDISGILKKDTSLVKGVANGNVLLKRVNKAYGIIADAQISNLFFRNITVGDLSLKAQNSTPEKFNFEVNLTGQENKLSANGFYIPQAIENSFHIDAVIQALSLKTVQSFSMGNLKSASGNVTGNLIADGSFSAPELTGELVFNNAFITPAVLNNQLELKHETLQLKKDGIYFNTFTIIDKDKNQAIINGAVKMNRFKDFNFALNVSSKDFLLFNTTPKDNKEFYGRMIIDSKVDVSGSLDLPVVNATVKMKKGSNFTFSVPDEKLTTDKGEDVVEFDNGLELYPILNRKDNKGTQKSSLSGYDVSSIIEIDKLATLRLLMDPASTDSLVVKGDAALSFTIDRSGKMSLTGAYNLNEGSYLVSLESIVKRRFDIDKGSTIIWNGDPIDANITINASYSVRASPIDLVADQMAGLSETDKNGYKQRYKFLVLLKLRGAMLHPVITFEIQLPAEDKGILGGAVNQKLAMLNENESALNKQVFALLVLGRFVQENPLQTDSNGGTSTLIRATVGKYLSQQLNQWSNKILPGVDLNFDIQSYNDYQSGSAKGRTQVDIGLKKQLFNERLSVQLGGSLDVEGERAKQNSTSNITSDVTIEYKITKDGRYRMKGFRHNLYEGVIEGQLVETGVGVLYVRDFNKWKQFFRLKKEKSDTLKKEKPHETINSK